MNKLTYNLLLIPITIVALIGFSLMFFWLTLPDMFDVHKLDLNSYYNYRFLVEGICNEVYPDANFDECRRGVIFSLNQSVLHTDDRYWYCFFPGVPLFLLYIFPIRKRLRKNWK